MTRFVNENFVMYVNLWGGYGGKAAKEVFPTDAPPWISKTTPGLSNGTVYPVLFEEYSFRGFRRGREITGRFRRKLQNKISQRKRKGFHGDGSRTIWSSKGVLGGKDGGVNKVQIEQNGQTYVPPHLSKDQNIHVQAGDKYVSQLQAVGI
ncbi:MAG: hypothetical protein CM1200mP30_07780 [Pseudomonadota bacterium]|nr:MAG: hypothetical protein CM1200mP30_07780 [Pseudomonadota bacterium]